MQGTCTVCQMFTAQCTCDRVEFPFYPQCWKSLEGGQNIQHPSLLNTAVPKHDPTVALDNTLEVFKHIYEPEQHPSIEVFNAPSKFNMPVYRVTGRGPAKKLIQCFDASKRALQTPFLGAFLEG